MNQGLKRTILRWIHVLFGLPLIGLVYVFMPALLVAGLWMWKGHLVERLLWKKSS